MGLRVNLSRTLSVAEPKRESKKRLYLYRSPIRLAMLSRSRLASLIQWNSSTWRKFFHLEGGTRSPPSINFKSLYFYYLNLQSVYTLLDWFNPDITSGQNTVRRVYNKVSIARCLLSSIFLYLILMAGGEAIPPGRWNILECIRVTIDTEKLFSRISYA